MVGFSILFRPEPKILTLCALLAVSGQGFANTVPIKFAKGSECGVFSGNVKGKKFTLQLGARQILNISTSENFKAVVKDPKGRTLSTFEEYDEIDYGGDLQLLYNTTTKGNYTISIMPRQQNQYLNVQFCAFND
ncbi:Uncharacterised protein [Moraxella lacunata]|uniref:Uncharacterized protein n=1 Tax=Moraxella lacunata TaxID=477 RepID=A0A378TSA9_MORLA|nr:hypothetical protein [Moraxella lacunata]STZ63164.1 Uncharacterised protein [Moraxella lacunata]